MKPVNLPQDDLSDELLSGLSDFEQAELQLLQSFSSSKLWAWLSDYLLQRRLALIAENIPTNDSNKLWMQKGAITEITRLLQAPKLVVEFYRQRLAEAAETAKANS